MSKWIEWELSPWGPSWVTSGKYWPPHLLRNDHNWDLFWDNKDLEWTKGTQEMFGNGYHTGEAMNRPWLEPYQKGRPYQEGKRDDHMYPRHWYIDPEWRGKKGSRHGYIKGQWGKNSFGDPADWCYFSKAYFVHKHTFKVRFQLFSQIQFLSYMYTFVYLLICVSTYVVHLLI